MICDYCNEPYNTSYAIYYKGRTIVPKDCCSTCTGKKTAEVSLVRRRDQAWNRLEEFCNEKNYTLITHKDDFTNVKMNIQYLCPKHELKIGMLDNMIHGHGCIDCKNEDMTYVMQHDPVYVEDFINSHNGNCLLNIEDYTNMTIHNLAIKCKCGNIYTTSFVNFRDHDVRQCSSCSNKQSKHESYICSILYELQINFIQEKRFSNCRDKKPLPFDFYLPDYNLIIEYDGEGHYLENFYKYYTDDPNSALLDRQRKDQIKNEYCKSKGIHLLRIPYWEKENVETIIVNKLNALKNTIETN